MELIKRFRIEISDYKLDTNIYIVKKPWSMWGINFKIKNTFSNFQGISRLKYRCNRIIWTTKGTIKKIKKQIRIKINSLKWLKGFYTKMKIYYLTQ